MLLTLIANKHGLLLQEIKIKVAITDAFRKILDESKRKPNKIWVDKGSEFYNRSMQSLSQNNDIEMYSKHNGGKSVIANKIF